MQAPQFFPLVSKMTGCSRRLCVLADPVFLAPAVTVYHLDPFSRKRSCLVVKMQAWHMPGLWGLILKYTDLFLGEGRAQNRDSGRFASVFPCASCTRGSRFCATVGKVPGWQVGNQSLKLAAKVIWLGHGEAEVCALSSEKVCNIFLDLRSCPNH